MKKFMSIKVAAPQAPAPATPPTDAASTLATFEALLRVANQTEHPSPAVATKPGRTKSSDGSSRKIAPIPRSPPIPTAIVSIQEALRAVDLAAEKLLNTETMTAPFQNGSTVQQPETPSSSAPPSSRSSTSTSTTSGVIKMCGYLKKKRNKMGGWRKLFFILQNQLLLSYSSRDDYEKKLAPFKDIINLVPGTMIIPTTGHRFIIETNSKVMYTFRCEDHRSCSEWIMALLDSLKAVNGGLQSDRKFSPQNIFQRSTLPLVSVSLPTRGEPFDGPIQPRLWKGPARASSDPAAVAIGPPKPPRSFRTNSRQPRESPTGGGAARQASSDDALNNNVTLAKPAAEGGNSVRSSTTSSSSNRTDSSKRRRNMAVKSHSNLHLEDPLPAMDDSKDVEGSSNRQKAGSDGVDEGGGEQPNASEELDPERWMWWLRQRKPGMRGQRQGASVEVSIVSAPTDRPDRPLPDPPMEMADDDYAFRRGDGGDDDGGSEDDVEEQVKQLEVQGEEWEKHSEGGGDIQQQQIFRLHPDARRKAHQSMDVCRINSMFGERQSQTVRTQHGKSVSHASDATEASRPERDQQQSSAVGRKERGEEQNQIKREGRGREKTPGRTTVGRKPIASSCSALPSSSSVALGRHDEEAPVVVHSSDSDGPSTPSIGGGRSNLRAPGGDPFAVYAEIRDYVMARNELREAASEPIYAVVDITTKRTRRAARQEQEQHQQQEHRLPLPDRNQFVSVSLPQIPSASGRSSPDGQRVRPVAKRSYSNNNDYEDVHDFLDRPDGSDGGDGASTASELNRGFLYRDEHIYEPILLPGQMIASDTSGSSTLLPVSASHQSGGGGGGLWKHLKRMHLQGSRHRLTLRRVFNGGQASAAAMTSPRQASHFPDDDGDGSSKDTRRTSTLEGLGRRLDSHRRSIKKRIKSLYDRSVPATVVATVSSSQVADLAEGAPEVVGEFDRGRSTHQSRKSFSLDSFLAMRAAAAGRQAHLPGTGDAS